MKPSLNYNPKECPEILKCRSRVTEDFCFRICRTKSFKNCVHFAKMFGTLKPPIQWLQDIAIRSNRGVDDIEQTTNNKRA